MPGSRPAAPEAGCSWLVPADGTVFGGLPDGLTAVRLPATGDWVHATREPGLLIGLSLGAEAALLTAARTPQVSAVVAFSPSDVVGAGVTPDGRQTSHWTARAWEAILGLLAGAL